MTPEQQRALALARARKRRSEAQSQSSDWRADGQSGLAEQVGSGTSEGVADILGLPVDLVTGGINGISGGINAIAGTEIPAIQDPIGGSSSMRRALSSFISEDQPQDAAQRYGRSIGREIGASAVPGGAALAKTAAPASALSQLLTSSIGSGAGAQAARDIAPGSAVAEMAGGLIGGSLPIAASSALRPSPIAPTIDDLRSQRDAAYSAVDNSNATVNPAARQKLTDALDNRMASERMHPRQHPRAVAAMDGLGENLPANPTIRDIEQERQIISRDVAGQFNDPSTARLGQSMKEEIDNYLNGLQPGDITGSDPQGTIDALMRGRNLHRRVKKSEELGFQQYKAENRASSTGVGGNSVNAMRQNIRQILDNPKRSAGYSPDEIAQMEKIVRGTGVDNALRRVAGLSPARGLAPAAMATISGIAGGATGNPIALGLLGAGGAGLVAQVAGEARTASQIKRLMDTVQNGGALARKQRLTGDEMNALSTLFLRALSGPQESRQ